MKIKRFYESDQNFDISSERIGEILNELKEISSILDNKSKNIDSYLNELDNYKSNSMKGNDQIDDSIFAFQVVKKNLLDSTDKLDIIINNLINYNDNGRKYLYSDLEKKI